MEKKLNIFDFFRSCIHFFKIVVLFFITLHFLYWTEHLIDANWTWMNFARPVLNLYVEFGACITEESITILGTTFEYKYILATGFYLITYFVINILNYVINELEYYIEKVVLFFKKFKEKSFNKTLTNEQIKEELSIKQYKIFVKTSIKKKFRTEDFNYNLEEQNQIMNEFLIKKTGILPKNFEGGFLYSFNDFSQIDSVLRMFFRLIKSKAPLDYIINVQIDNDNNNGYVNKIKLLSDLEIQNKIIMLTETAYRYRFNDSKKYKTVQLGLYQKISQNIEVCEFIEY
ncbi:MAG: hypothetical protein MJ230_04270 [bacterium]|nr:hypothetical protein [bacterium]